MAEMGVDAVVNIAKKDIEKKDVIFELIKIETQVGERM